MRHPDANAIYGIFDAPTLDIATAVVGSGRQNDIFVMGEEGTAPVVTLIREGRGVNAGVGYSVVWEYYAALDAINRLIAGEKPASTAFPSGIGVQIFTKDRNLPPQGARFNGPVDFKWPIGKRGGSTNAMQLGATG